MGSVRTDYDRIAEKIGPGIMHNDPLVVGHLAALRAGFVTVEDALVSCVRALSVVKEAALKQIITFNSHNVHSQIIVVTEERYEELKEELGT